MRNANMGGLLVAQRKAVSAQAKFDRIAQRRATEDFYPGTVAKAHFQQPAAQFRVAANADHVTAAANTKLVQAAGLGIGAIVAGHKPA
jgi:hypothetical protein